MRLTNYGRRVLSRTTAVAAMLVMVTGAIMTVTNGAGAIFGIEQKAYNVLYIALIMPISFAIMIHIAYTEYDRRYEKDLQGNSKGR